MFKRLFEPYKGLSRSVYVIFLSTVLNNLGNFVGPVLTLLLTYKMNVDVKLVALVVSINGILGLFGAILGGRLVDKYGRKIIFISFKTLAALAFVMCAYISNAYVMISILMFGSFTSGITSPVFNTMITDITSPEDRKQAFALRYMGINVGYAIGPVIAVYLYYHDLMKVLFLGDALTMMLSIVLIGVLVKETMPDHIEKIEKEKSTLTALLDVKILFWFSLVIVMYFIVFSQFNFGISLTLKELFNDKGPIYYGYMMSLNAILCSVFTVIITEWTKSIKPAKSIQIGGLFYVIGFGMMAFINSLWLFFISTLIWTIGEILVATNTSVFIANQAPITHRGRFNAIFPMIRRLGFFLGPIIAGLVIDGFGVRMVWIVMGVIALLGSIFMGKINTHIIKGDAYE